MTNKHRLKASLLMAQNIFLRDSALIFSLCLLSVSCKKKELYVIDSQTPANKTIYCSVDEATLIDTNHFKRMPLFDQLTVVDRENGGGGTIDYSDTTFMCDSWNFYGTSDIYRTFFGLPDFCSLPVCTKIKKANLWLHSDHEPADYVANPSDSIQILLTCWPKDSIDKIRWTYYPTYYTNTLSVSNKPYEHDTWICFDITYMVQNIIQKNYKNNLLMMRTSGENMFIPFTRQKNLIGPKNERKELRPYFEIIF
jgi:hypothetical protein